MTVVQTKPRVRRYSQKRAELLDELVRVAEAGEPMPTDSKLATQFECYAKAISVHVNILAEQGQINIERDASGRRRITVSKQSGGSAVSGWSVPQTRSKAGRHGYTRRNCLCCQKPFQSWGIGNRLCGYCKKKDEGL